MRVRAALASVAALSAQAQQVAPIWKFPTGGAVTAPPSVGSDGTIFVGSADANVRAVNPDGTQKWVFKTGGPVSSSPKLSPDGSLVIVGSDGE